jgi:hypothetical protein
VQVGVWVSVWVSMWVSRVESVEAATCRLSSWEKKLLLFSLLGWRSAVDSLSLDNSSAKIIKVKIEIMASFHQSDGYGDGRMKKMGKSKPVYETESEETGESETESEEEETQFDGDGVLMKREAANRRARIDKEKRYIAEARPHKARSGGGGGDHDNDWQIQRGRSNGRGRGRNANAGNSRNEDRNGKNHKFTHLKPNSGATNEEAAARGSNSLGDTAPPTAVAQS